MNAIMNVVAVVITGIGRYDKVTIATIRLHFVHNCEL